MILANVFFVCFVFFVVNDYFFPVSSLARSSAS